MLQKLNKFVVVINRFSYNNVILLDISISIWNPFLSKKLLNWRNRRYRTTIEQNCHTNWSIKIQSLYGKLLYLMTNLHDIRHGPRQRYTLWRKFSDRNTIAYSYHTNWPTKFKFLYKIFCICEGYYSFDATEVNVSSCFFSQHNFWNCFQIQFKVDIKLPT